MPNTREQPQRRSIRLPGYDYRQAGIYFVTICTWERQMVFGEIVDGEMILSEFGQIVKEEWLRSATIRRELQLDEFMVMPNHLHGIVEIVGATGRSPLQHKSGPPSHSLGSLIAGFKSAVTTRINNLRHTPGIPLWQRNYYEHIIRDEDELHGIREYIQTNPLRWELDRENPHQHGEDEFDQWLALFTKKQRR